METELQRATRLLTNFNNDQSTGRVTWMSGEDITLLDRLYPDWRKIPADKKGDPVSHPKHYNSHPSGVECITITRHMGFNLGNAMKYIWRADEKGNAIQDLEKARWYIEDEIQKRKNKGVVNG